ncbi:TIGR02300 family protein [Methylobacterium nonmethylotrophicum]|uniref:TIGR02300 family protein n=1 Tax=Methylobacterium nonmethylotrophicum TaxID=1141884 RepID=A0A4Z0NTD7_9HYPH|nr:TIGR02300 family protein [Methylobacterium nonmethylotrophicum]TGE00300.1 TIGR02300 family protein [Methylobacterium nonmethylotrophicum]
MARPELGLKRQCMSCGAKFYDLSRDPAVCPKCGTVYQVAALSTTRVPAPAIANRAPREEEAEEEAGAPEMVSLDEVEAAEDGADVSVDDDADVGDAGTDDDTFLEEDEESGDDVSDFIDGDIESDEES